LGQQDVFVLRLNEAVEYVFFAAVAEETRAALLLDPLIALQTDKEFEL